MLIRDPIVNLDPVADSTASRFSFAPVLEVLWFSFPQQQRPQKFGDNREPVAEKSRDTISNLLAQITRIKAFPAGRIDRPHRGLCQ